MTAGAKTPITQFAEEKIAFGNANLFGPAQNRFFALVTSVIDPEANPPTFTEPDPTGTRYARFDMSGTGNNPTDVAVGIANALGYQLQTFTAPVGGVRHGAICSGSTPGVADALWLDVLTNGNYQAAFVDSSTSPATMRAPGHVMSDGMLVNARVQPGGNTPGGLVCNKGHFYRIVSSDHAHDTYKITEENGSAVTITSDGIVTFVEVREVDSSTFVANTAATIAQGAFTLRET